MLTINGLVKKEKEKHVNQISNFKELEWGKSLNINQQKLKRNLNNMNQVMDIIKINDLI